MLAKNPTHFRKGGISMFERIQEQMRMLHNGEIQRLDQDVIEDDLTNFFETTSYNIYAGDKRKITKALKNSGLPVLHVTHENHGAWNPIITVVSYTVNPFIPEVATFAYSWG